MLLLFYENNGLYFIFLHIHLCSHSCLMENKGLFRVTLWFRSLAESLLIYSIFAKSNGSYLLFCRLRDYSIFSSHSIVDSLFFLKKLSVRILPNSRRNITSHDSMDGSMDKALNYQAIKSRYDPSSFFLLLWKVAHFRSCFIENNGCAGLLLMTFFYGVVIVLQKIRIV